MRRIGAIACGLALGLTPALADTVVLDAVQDTMILQEFVQGANGAGQHFCVGVNGNGSPRRSLIRFDLSSIPAGSTIDSVTLDLYVDRTAPSAGGTFDLHRLTAGWGEAGSQGSQGECQGASGQLGDATWDWTFYDPADPGSAPQWAASGGDAAPFASSSIAITSIGHQLWTSGAMAGDVQSWFDNSATNFGWLIRRTSETGVANAVRFSSRQNSNASRRPKLTVNYTSTEVDGACCFPGLNCVLLTSTQCSVQGGNFQGENSVCSPNPCPPDATGACCATDGSCTLESELDCDAASGAYQGDGVTCGTINCPVSLVPYVDPLPIPAVAQPVSGQAGDIATYDIAMQEVQQQLHRDLPPTTVWGYTDTPADHASATFPGPTIETFSNRQVTVNWLNELRDTSAGGDPKPYRTDHYLAVDGAAAPPACHIHGAEDLPKSVVHLHGGHTPAEFDGYPEFTYLPGNQDTYIYPNNQLPSTLWYHDHALGITRLNVYMGMAGFWLVRNQAEIDLNLPSGEFDVPLAIQDRTLNGDGSLFYPASWMDHFFGDKILVNGKVWPYFDVKQGKYRFRVLNGSGSRTYTLTLDRLDIPGTADVTFAVIGTEGGLIDLPLPRNEITLAPAERIDIVVDFGLFPPGTEILMTNSAPAPFPGPAGQGVVPEVMKFVVQDLDGFSTALPSVLTDNEVLQESDAIRTREFVLDKEGDACGSVWKINGLEWDDIVEYPTLGTTEIWSFINPRFIMHPMHMHLVFFQVLDRTPIGGGTPIPPGPDERGWKDTARADAQMVTRVIARFEDYPGKFAYHCHILEHEDHEMMRQFWAVEAIQLQLEGDELNWTVQPGAASYDVVRGDLGNLRSSGGNFALSSVTESCLAPGEIMTMAFDNEVPAVGQGFWYLVRASDAAGAATYDCGSSVQADRRDDEIAASGKDCP